MNRSSIIFVTAISLFMAQPLYACPSVYSYIDVNCDGFHKIVFTGDSIVAGVRDEPEGRGGYVGRLQRKFRHSEISNLGVPGITSGRLLRKFTRAFKSITFKSEAESNFKELPLHADIIIIDVGRNDYWRRIPVEETIRNIKRLVQLFKTEIPAITLSSPPMVAVTTMTPTTRAFQRSFLNALNYSLIKLRGINNDLKVRSDGISEDLISYDGIHPSKKGYDALSVIMTNFIREIGKVS